MLHLCYSLALAGVPPTFPLDFYVGTQDDIIINQGGYPDPTGGACCSSSDASQCKIQSESMGGDFRQWGSTNRTRDDSAQGVIVTDYRASVNKEMALLPGSSSNSSHAWVCAQYCPNQFEFTSILQIGDGVDKGFDKVKDLGEESVTQPKAVGGKTAQCEHWQWFETILGILKMDRQDFFTTKDTPPAPWFHSMAITPFGMQQIGEENSSYVGYKPTTTPETDFKTHFDIGE
jgi:hypothetical protein